MRDFLNNRLKYSLSEYFQASHNKYNDPIILLSSLNSLITISEKMTDTSVFLDDNSLEVLESVNAALLLAEKKSKAVLSRLNHYNKTKTILPRSKSSNVSLLNLSDGKYTNISYSVIDGGLILKPKSTFMFEANPNK